MHDYKKWNLAAARFVGFANNTPNTVNENRVNEYHSIIDALQEASGENLSAFRISAEELRPKTIRGQVGLIGYPRHTEYSAEKYCDNGYFARQLHGLAGYLKHIRNEHTAPATPYVSYRTLSDSDLRDLAASYGIPPKKIVDARGEHFAFDREHFISALTRYDAAQKLPNMQPSVSNTWNIQNMVGSVIQQGTHGSQASADFEVNVAGLGSLLEKVKNSADEFGLNEVHKTQLIADAETVQAQLSSPEPKLSVMKECLHSMRSIVEQVVANTIASGIVHEIGKYLKVLGG